METGNGGDKIRGELTCGMYARRRKGEEERRRGRRAMSSQTLSFAVSLKVGCGGSPRDRSFDGSEVLLILLMIVMIID